MWTMEIIFAVFIFIVIVGLFWKVLPIFESNEDKIDDVLFEARSLSETLMSKGVPEEWNTSNVIRPGIIEKNMIASEEKLRKFYNLSNQNYTLTKNSFGMNSDFAVYIKNQKGSVVTIEGEKTAGTPKTGFVGGELNITGEHIVKLERTFIYKNDPVKMVVFTWQ